MNQFFRRISPFVFAALAAGTDTHAGPDTTFRMKRPARTIHEQMPHFKGDLNGFINSHLKYPKAALRKGQAGRVVVHFVVNTDGYVQKVTLQRSTGYDALDDEALRVIKLMEEEPYWLPGIQDGKAVKVEYTLPFTFSIDR